MDENQNSMSKHTNNTPFVVFRTKNERNDQRKKTSSTLKNKGLENNDLTGNKTKKSVGY